VLVRMRHTFCPSFVGVGRDTHALHVPVVLWRRLTDIVETCSLRCPLGDARPGTAVHDDVLGSEHIYLFLILLSIVFMMPKLTSQGSIIHFLRLSGDLSSLRE
jgi:hypothetical protein